MAFARGREAHLVTKCGGMGGGKAVGHRALRVAGEERVPEHDDAHVPFAVKPPDQVWQGAVVVLDLIAWVDEAEAAARCGRGQSERNVEPVALVDSGMGPVRERAAECCMFGRVKFGEMQPVRGAQGECCDQRRAGIGVRTVKCARAGEYEREGMGGGQAVAQRAGGSSLAGAQGLGGGKVVEAAPGMAFEVGERLVLLREIGERGGEGGMLVQVGEVSGVIEVLLGKHGWGLSRGRTWRQRAVASRAGWLRRSPCRRSWTWRRGGEGQRWAF